LLVAHGPLLVAYCKLPIAVYDWPMALCQWLITSLALALVAIMVGKTHDGRDQIS
jgi:hypothetical protein